MMALAKNCPAIWSILVVLLLRTGIAIAVTDADVTAILQELYAMDANRAGPNDAIVSYQNMASHTHFDHDNAQNPFFTSVSDQLLNRPSYSTLRILQSQFVTPNADQPEPWTSEKNDSISIFIDVLHGTSVMQRAINWLTTNSLLNAPDYASFKAQMIDMWFGLYARGGAAMGSSGFENVFVGETLDGEVLGLSNWVRFYQLEQQDQIDYHGWFERQMGTQVSLQFAWNEDAKLIGSIFLNTSPEFELSAYTICALASPGENNCRFMANDFQVLLSATVITTTEQKIRINTAYPSISIAADVSTTARPPAGTTIPNIELQALVDQMRAADVDKAGPGDYALNWGNPVHGSDDTSPQPLFTFVNETLFNRPLYANQLQMYNATLFTPSVFNFINNLQIGFFQVCTEELPMMGLKRAFLQNFFYLITNTTVFNMTYQFLAQKGIVPGNWASYADRLWTLWYGTYTRCRGPVGSSGFEHVFSGEWKDPDVDGHHSWVRYYLQEKAGLINYHGYWSYEGNLIGTFQYTWQSYMKYKGGFFIGTSPAFDFSALTLCALAHPNGAGCHFTVDGYRITVTSYTQACADGGTCLATAYPSDE